MKPISMLLLTAATLFSFTACEGQKKDSKSDGAMKTTLDSVSYGIGVSIGTSLKKDNLDKVSVDLMAKGINEAIGGTSTMNQEQAQEVIRAYMEGVKAEKQKANTEKGKKFLEDNGKKEGVTTLPSGLQYQVIKMGTGAKPALTDKVSTHYHGTLIDGSVFDSSVERGEPVSFPVNGVIPGWTEALQLMPVGSKWKLFIPSNLAYGDQGAGGMIGPNETLVFEVELLNIEK